MHGPDHVDRVAVAGVGVGDHRDVDRLGDPSGVVDHLRKRHQPDVGAAETRCGAAETGHVRSREPGLLDQPRSQRVVAARSQHHLAGLEALAQTTARAASDPRSRAIEKRQSPVGWTPAASTIRIEVRTGARVRCSTCLGTV